MGPTEKKLFEEFCDRGILRGKTFLLDQENAIDYVHRSFALGALVLGIDSFELIGESIRTKDCVDYSASCYRLSAPDVWKEAEHFLRKHSQRGLLFEVVIGESEMPKDEGSA